MLAGIVFDRFGGPAVGVAFTQDRVDRAAFYFVIAHFGLFLRPGGGCFGVVGEGEPLRLQLGDRCFELGHRGADVGKFDDVGAGLKGQGAEFGQGISRLLPGRQKVGKGRKDASRQRNVAKLDPDPCRFGEGGNDREEGVSGEQRGFVGLGVNDGGLGRHKMSVIKARCAAGSKQRTDFQTAVGSKRRR